MDTAIAVDPEVDICVDPMEQSLVVVRLVLMDLVAFVRCSIAVGLLVTDTDCDCHTDQVHLVRQEPPHR